MAQSPDGVWQFVAVHPRPLDRPASAGPSALVRVDRTAFDRLFRNVPREGTVPIDSGVEFYLPSPDRTFVRVRAVESPILAPELAAAYPGIRTYTGQGVDDRTLTVRFGWTERGFHALLLGAAGDISIDAYAPGDLQYCITMRKSK